MTDMPDIDAAISAVRRYRDDVSAALAKPVGLSARASADLAARANDLHNLAEDARDATLAMARKVGASWALLQMTTGTSDATLVSRLARWEERA